MLVEVTIAGESADENSRVCHAVLKGKLSRVQQTKQVATTCLFMWVSNQLYLSLLWVIHQLQLPLHVGEYQLHLPLHVGE